MFHTDGYEAEDSGGPEELLPVAAEAWRRAGDLEDEELYPVEAAWAGVLEKQKSGKQKDEMGKSNLDTRNAAKTGWRMCRHWLPGGGRRCGGASEFGLTAGTFGLNQVLTVRQKLTKLVQ